MRVEPHGIGSGMHVVKRGARGADIVRDADDRRHFARSLFFLNDTYQDHNVTNLISGHESLQRPDHWLEGEPLVAILAWTLMPNHFHLILQETREGGIAKFMQRLCGSMSARSNAKHSESGSLFQGGYKGRIVEDDADLRWLASYVMVKNVFELYPGGLKKAVREFNHAWKWSEEYAYSSMSVYASRTDSPIIARNNVLMGIMGVAEKFKCDARDMVQEFISRRAEEYSEDRARLMLE